MGIWLEQYKNSHNVLSTLIQLSLYSESGGDIKILAYPRHEGGNSKSIIQAVLVPYARRWSQCGWDMFFGEEKWLGNPESLKREDLYSNEING